MELKKVLIKLMNLNRIITNIQLLQKRIEIGMLLIRILKRVLIKKMSKEMLLIT